MDLRSRTDKIRKILRKIYPEVKTQLFYETPFQLLVAAMLSAQCTDKQVNRVTGDLFQNRISARLGLTENKDPVKIEFDLMKIIPKRAWNEFSLQLIFFGRQTCMARKPKCPTCPLADLCPWPEKRLV
jgi:endonuclease III